MPKSRRRKKVKDKRRKKATHQIQIGSAQKARLVEMIDMLQYLQDEEDRLVAEAEQEEKDAEQGD